MTGLFYTLGMNIVGNIGLNKKKYQIVLDLSDKALYNRHNANVCVSYLENKHRGKEHERTSKWSSSTYLISTRKIRHWFIRPRSL